jgi:hypothetical protein
MNNATSIEAEPHVIDALVEHYRCLDDCATFAIGGALADSIKLTEIYGDISPDCPHELLQCDPSKVLDYCRHERYITRSTGDTSSGARRLAKNTYYFLRPFLPFALRNQLKKIHSRGWKNIKFPSWPVDCTVETILEQLLTLSLKARGVNESPFIWFWPEGYSSCVIMTHDVETMAGRDFCCKVMDMNDCRDIKSSFQIVPEERYPVTSAFLSSVRDRGFEINIHDLNHDGHLFDNHAQFVRRVERINQYAEEYGAVGFRSGAMYRNPDWYSALGFSYDMSFPNVARLDPQQGGCCTVMPYFIGKVLELPLTTIQDYFLFHALNEYSPELWRRQIELIMKKNGLISFLVHPDYIIEERAQNTYQVLLDCLARLRSEGNVWIALPCEVERWWRQRSQMRLSRRGDKLQIEGAGRERARIAYASLDGHRVKYSVGETKIWHRFVQEEES